MIRKYIKPGTQLPFRLSARERAVVVEKALLDPEIERALQGATAVGAKLVVNLNLDDIDDLHGCVAAEANHCDDPRVKSVLDAVCDRLGALLDRFTDESPAPLAAPPAPVWKPRFTAKQGQYLAFIHSYTNLHRTPPAEADLQRYFKVTPPTVHAMILTLERQGLIDRTPGQARSIRLRVRERSCQTCRGRERPCDLPRPANTACRIVRDPPVQTASSNPRSRVAAPLRKPFCLLGLSNAGKESRIAGT